MLGHASAAMTLDTYADLFDEDLDDVAARLEKSRSDALGTASSGGGNSLNVVKMLPQAASGE